MSNLLSEQKEKLLSRISYDMYYGLINYMKEIYNGDYDVIILMARRFSNLYSAMLPLVKAEYFGSIQDEHERMQIPDADERPFVISDRAVDIILTDIYQKKDKTRFKRVLLADDIIIHGTTLNGVCEQIEGAYKKNEVSDYKVEVIAYAQNEEGSVTIKNLISKEKIEKCNANTWKKISSNFLDILYIMGQTYTSYVPSARIKADTRNASRINLFLNEKGAEDITDINMERNNVKAYAISEYKDQKVINDSFQLFETYRIYQFKDRNEMVFVPMVTLKPISSSMLDSYYNILSHYINEVGKVKIENILNSEVCSGEYKYRLIVYILSALKGYDFWKNRLNLIPEELEYDIWEEKLNFSCVFLNGLTKMSEFKDFSKTYEEIQKVYISSKNQVPDEFFCQSDVGVKKMIAELDSLVAELVCKEQQNNDDDSIGSELIGKLLQTNSKLDEEAFQKTVKRIRITGVPLISMAQKLVSLGSTLGSVVDKLLFAIDYGKGSIIPHKFIKNGEVFYTSVLRAGEQNYRYLIDRYMPVMYGMYLLEKYDKSNYKKDNKELLWSRYAELKGGNNPFWERDKEYLLGRIMTGEFENILVDEALEKSQDKKDETLNIIIDIVNEILAVS